jgi:hypothetical protein
MLSKKNVVFGFLAIVAIEQIDAMQITTRYEPGFVAKNSQAINIGKSLLCAGCTYGLTVYGASETFLSMGLSASALVASYCYGMRYNRLVLVDSLLIDPRESFKDMQRVHDAYFEHVKQTYLYGEMDAGMLTNELNRLSQQYEQKCPLFLVDECSSIKKEKFSSVLSRNFNHVYKKCFEEKVSQHLVEKIISQQNVCRAISYVNVSCGGSLSALVILTKVLAERPNAWLHVHCIEDDNDHYVAVADLLGVSRAITSNQQALNCNDDKFEAYVQGIKLLVPFTEAEVRGMLVYDCCTVGKKYTQMIKWLSHTFPKAKLSLLVHESCKSYFDYVNKHSLAVADVLSAVDIEDKISCHRTGCSHNYVKLCAEILKKNANASNVYLLENEEAEAIISWASLSPIDGADETTEIKNGDIPIHLALKKL